MGNPCQKWRFTAGRIIELRNIGDRMGTVAITPIRWNINPISIVSPSDYLLLIVVRYSMIVHYTNISGTEPQTPMVYD